MMHDFLPTKNTGLTETEYGRQSVGAEWRLLIWNDQAHLGE